MPGYIVFVRFFLDYSPTFPFERFAHLKDCDLGGAVEAFERQEQSKVSNRKRAQADRAESEKRLREWTEGALLRPGTKLHLASAAPGWRDSGFEDGSEEPEGNRPATSQDLPSGITPCFPIARFDSKDKADAATGALQERTVELARAALDKPRLDGVDLWLAIANPRFFAVPEAKLSTGELAGAHERIGRLGNPVSATIPLEEGLVRCYMPLLLATLERIGSASEGPDDRFVFRFGGRQLDLADSPLRYRLVCELWDANSSKPHSSVELDRLMEALYPHDDEAESAFKDLCKQTRRAFERANIPLTIRQRGLKIWLETRPA